MICYPKISVITAVSNCKTNIEQCILSVVDQTYPNLEHIFIDGQSTDDTLDKIKKHSLRYQHIRWISEKDEGIYDAMNKGIKIAAGDWLYFLGSDDVFYDKDVLNSIFQKNDPDQSDIIAGNVMLKQSGIIFKNHFSFLQILERGFHHQGIFYRKKLFDKCGKFEIKYKYLADWAFNLKWFNDKDIKRLYVNQTIAVYNETGFSSQGEDITFERGKGKLIKRYFSPIIFIFYKSRLSAAVDVAEKALKILRRRGMGDFVKNIYRYLIFGRSYFRKGIALVN